MGIVLSQRGARAVGHDHGRWWHVKGQRPSRHRAAAVAALHRDPRPGYCLLSRAPRRGRRRRRRLPVLDRSRALSAGGSPAGGLRPTRPRRQSSDDDRPRRADRAARARADRGEHLSRPEPGPGLGQGLRRAGARPGAVGGRADRAGRAPRPLAPRLLPAARRRRQAHRLHRRSIRDGKSFTTRRVVAVQNGRAIFNMAASFQIDEAGFDHQAEDARGARARRAALRARARPALPREPARGDAGPDPRARSASASSPSGPSRCGRSRRCRR